MKYLKVFGISICLILLSALAVFKIAGASDIQTGKSITVPAGQTVDSALFSGGNDISIAGKVNGDVYCAGQNVVISGTVDGDVICAGQSVSISGTVTGSARLVGQSVTISGQIEGSASIAAQTLNIGKNGVIGRDLLGGSQDINIDGAVKRDILSDANNLAVNGLIGRNVQGRLDNVTVGTSGKVIGNLDYTGPNDPTVQIGGKITGKINRTQPKDENGISRTNLINSAVALLVYTMLTLLVLGLAIAWLMPGILDETTATAMKHPGQAILVGAAATFLVPVAIFLLFITIVGIPLALLIILSWIVIMILMTPFAAYLLGRTLLKNLKSPGWIMLAGIVLLMILYIIPVVDIIVAIGVYLFGTGMILTQGRKLFYKPAIAKSDKE